MFFELQIRNKSTGKEIVSGKFKSVATHSLVDSVCRKLVVLLQKKLKVGNIIPREIELAETIGVSRAVIREALLRSQEWHARTS